MGGREGGVSASAARAPTPLAPLPGAPPCFPGSLPLAPPRPPQHAPSFSSSLTQQDDVKKIGIGLGVCCQHGPAPKHQRVGVPPLRRAQRHPQPLQQLQQVCIIQLPRQGEALGAWRGGLGG